jgi:hypothetical protein
MSAGVTVLYLAAARRDEEVRKLAEPWIADEGALDAGLRRGVGEMPLRLRGLAFDERTTVVWDEDAVQVLGGGEPDPEVIALRSRVLLREGFAGPARLFRIDYLRRGALLGSRFTTEGEVDA